MRVLHVHSGNLFGGVERILETLAVAGAGSGMTTAAALCAEGRLGERLAIAGAEVHQLGAVRASRPWQVAAVRRALADVLARTAPDVAVVHSDWSHALFGGTILGAGVPLVRWLHAPEPGPAWQAWGAGRSTPTLVICNSHYTCRGSQRRFAGARRAVCYAPVAQHHASRAAAREARGLSPSTVVILLAARLEHGKGHRTLLNAAAALPPGDWQIWIAGGPQREPERRMLAELAEIAHRSNLVDRVRFLGERGDVQHLMAAADIYCQPNDGPESYGLSFVEAMQAGLPIVSTGIGAIPEIVDATCGVLVPPGRADEVAHALGRLLAEPSLRSDLSQGAAARAAALGDPAVRVAEIVDALRSARADVATQEVA